MLPLKREMHDSVCRCDMVICLCRFRGACCFGCNQSERACEINILGYVARRFKNAVFHLGFAEPAGGEFLSKDNRHFVVGAVSSSVVNHVQTRYRGILARLVEAIFRRADCIGHRSGAPPIDPMARVERGVVIISDRIEGRLFTGWGRIKRVAVRTVDTQSVLTSAS